MTRQFVIRDDESDQIDIQSDFVIYDDDVKQQKKQNKQKKQKNPQAKKTALTITVTALVLVFVLAAGFAAYKIFGEFKYSKNIYVNDIAISGLTKDEAATLLQAEQDKLLDSISIDVVAAEEKLTLTKDDFSSYIFNTDEVLEEAKAYCKDNFVSSEEKRYEIKIAIDDTVASEVAEHTAKELDQDVKEAVVTKFDSSKKGSKKFTIEDSQTGIKIKKPEFAKQLSQFFEDGKFSGEIETEVELEEPVYSKEFLQKNLKKISGFTTVSTNNANGNSNMKLSLSQCNNSIIDPGKTWSFNDCTGNSNLTSNGYKSAGVIVNGKKEEGVGGGICQSSTTIYNAAILCGMEVVERSCHYFQSSYVDVGRDATVDYGNLDLKVKNPFDYQLFMECYMDGTTLHCNMYGLENPDFDEIKISSSITSYFSRGYKAQTTRTYYKDKKKIKTESLPSSTYYTSSPDDDSSDSSSSKKSSKKQTNSQSTSTKPESTKPESTKPESTKPESTKPESSSTPVETTPPSSSEPENTSSVVDEGGETP